MNFIKHCRYLPVLILIIFLVSLTGCNPGSSPGTCDTVKIEIITTIFPVTDVIKNIGGDFVSVSCLLPSGASPHTFEPTVAQAIEISEADLFVYIGSGLDNWALTLTKASGTDLPVLRLTKNIQLHDGHLCTAHHSIECTHEAHENTDPHIWLDPVIVRDHIVPAITEALTDIYPEYNQFFDENSRAYRDILTMLDEEITEITSSFVNNDFISFHSAWQYFARRYGLKEAGVIAECPGQEPSAKWIADLIHVIEETGVTTLFAEPQLNPAMAESIANEINGKVLLMDPLGGEDIEGRSSYIELMRYNTDVLKKGLGR